MANNNIKARIKSNNNIFNTWAIIAAIVSLITGFIIFFILRDKSTPTEMDTAQKKTTKDKPKQKASRYHPVPYTFALIVAIVCLVYMKKAIKVTKDSEGKLSTTGDLSGHGRHAIFIDLLGVSLGVMIFSTFWKYALLFYLSVPIYFLCWGGKKIVQWLRFG